MLKLLTDGSDDEHYYSDSGNDYDLEIGRSISSDISSSVSDSDRPTEKKRKVGPRAYEWSGKTGCRPNSDSDGSKPSSETTASASGKGKGKGMSTKARSRPAHPEPWHLL